MKRGIKSLAIGLILVCGLVLPQATSKVTVFNNWDGVTTVPITAQGGSTLTEGEFWSLGGNEQLRITSGTNTGFLQFAKTPSFARNSSFLTALAGGQSLQLDYRTFAADNTLTTNPCTVGQSVTVTDTVAAPPRRFIRLRVVQP
jgi:hypothetical protein